MNQDGSMGDPTRIAFAEDMDHQWHKLGWIMGQLVVLSYSAFLARDRWFGIKRSLALQCGLSRSANIAPQVFALIASALSWLFIASALVVQVAAYDSPDVCNIAAWICCTMYAMAKVFLYMVMIEKVRLGHLTIMKNDCEGCCPYYLDTAARPKPRFDDALYKFNWMLLCVYPLILVDMLVTKQAEIDGNSGRCRIGLPYISSLPLLIADVFYTVWLTWQFYRALTHMNDPKLERVACKNFYAALVSMFFTELNLSSFVITANGLLPVHLCLGMCTVDIAVNVYVVNWLMSSGPVDDGSPRTRKNAVARSQLRLASPYGSAPCVRGASPRRRSSDKNSTERMNMLSVESEPAVVLQMSDLNLTLDGAGGGGATESSGSASS